MAERRARIVIRRLAKTFREGGREVAAVQDVDVDVHDQEFVAIVGPSGCGKSTILNMIGGLVTPSAGTGSGDVARAAGRLAAMVGSVCETDAASARRSGGRVTAGGGGWGGEGGGVGGHAAP